MDLKKVLDQTVRELKREVNKKVLKVPEIEQKVLDATSNEPWGPHGTLMSDIAQATRNYNEYQMIMAVLWKRINDTGRNWRHVYKALTVLEFLVAHGSERVIDDLREHAYQISTLTDFQYIESSGKDQGINVRKKAQTLVALVNDKEKIREVRQKAVANRDKYRGVSSTGGIYKPSSYSSTGSMYGGDRYDDDRYGSTSRYEGRDDDRYGRDRDGDRYRDEDRYGRDWDRQGRDADRYGREGDRYRDEYNGDYDHEVESDGSRRGDDRQGEKYNRFEKDRAYDDDDSRSSRNGRGRGDEYDDRRTDRKPSSARMPPPPSYEDALGSSDSGYRTMDDRRDGEGLVAAVARASKSNVGHSANSEITDSVNKATVANNQSDDFDDFDPRASKVTTPAAAPRSDDFFGQVELVGPVKALLPPPSASSAFINSNDLIGASDFPSGVTPASASVDNVPMQQLDGGVFGDSPFKVETPVTLPTVATSNPASTFLSASAANDFASVTGSNDSNSFNAFGPVPANPPASVSFGGNGLFTGDSFSGFGAASNGVGSTSPFSFSNPAPVSNSLQQPALGSSTVNQAQTPITQAPVASFPQQLASQGPKTTLNSNVKPPQKDKFETKSTVWADSLNKGLIDLNIAGPKTNPLAGIGIDFDLLRTERIKEERATTKASTTTMGKAMGSGSGLGVAGASAIVPPVVPQMMVGMGMAPMGMGMGMGMGPGMGMGMGAPMMPTGVNPGMAGRPAMGMGPSSGMGMGLNPMMGMGMGGYPNQQQQYGGFR